MADTKVRVATKSSAARRDSTATRSTHCEVQRRLPLLDGKMQRTNRSAIITNENATKATVEKSHFTIVLLTKKSRRTKTEFYFNLPQRVDNCASEIVCIVDASSSDRSTAIRRRQPRSEYRMLYAQYYGVRERHVLDGKLLGAQTPPEQHAGRRQRHRDEQHSLVRQTDWRKRIDEPPELQQRP